MNQKTYKVNINQTKSSRKIVLKGKLLVPPSKSMSHRAIICASLSKIESVVENLTLSEDIETTIKAMQCFGATIRLEQDEETKRYCAIISNSQIEQLLETKRLDNQNKKNQNLYDQEHSNSKITEVYCHESGSTARFLIPFFHLLNGPVKFTGTPRLSERPYTAYLELFDLQNISYQTQSGGLPLTVQGRLKAGEYPVVGNVSSQFISGLMFVLPLLEQKSKIVITPPLESKAYITLTKDCLKTFGIHIEEKDELNYIIAGGQTYKGTNYKVEGDYSQAAFWIVANALGAEVELSGIQSSSKQADKAIIDIIRKIERQEWLEKPCRIDVAQYPDIVPILAVYCSLKRGNYQIVNAERLRIKESDRLKAMATELTKMGADISESEDGLVIKGVEYLIGAEVDSWNDHRIAMALSIAATFAKGQTTINNAHCVRKSYPNFWDDYKMLGGQINVE